MSQLRPAALLALCAAFTVGSIACKSDSGGSGSSASGPAAGSEIEAGLAFLKAVAKLNHRDQADDAWGEMSNFAGSKVKLLAGSESGRIDIAGKHTDAKLLRFSKLTTWRDGNTIKGLLLGDVELKFEKGEVRGPGKLHLDAKGDQWVATLLEVEPGEPGGAPATSGGGAAPNAAK
jgi:hypothetical protein